jgi:hypothetical protein
VNLEKRFVFGRREAEAESGEFDAFELWFPRK